MSSKFTYDLYIAAPFFNAPQISIVERIERMCDAAGLTYYSPRLHSGSADLTSEQRKDFNAWKPVLDSNIKAIVESRLLLAVWEYAMPDGIALVPAKYIRYYDFTDDIVPPKGYVFDVNNTAKPIELPDNGVVFECGYAHATFTPIVAFHSTKQPSELNLMLTHTAIGVITGWEKLEIVIKNYDSMMLDWDDLSTLNSKLLDTVQSEVI